MKKDILYQNINVIYDRLCFALTAFEDGGDVSDLYEDIVDVVNSFEPMGVLNANTTED